jgi:hypothetical protein
MRDASLEFDSDEFDDLNVDWKNIIGRRKIKPHFPTLFGYRRHEEPALVGHQSRAGRQADARFTGASPVALLGRCDFLRNPRWQRAAVGGSCIRRPPRRASAACLTDEVR